MLHSSSAIATHFRTVVLFKIPSLLILPLAAMEKVRDILSEARGATSELYGAFY